MRISKKAILEGLRALYPDAAPELHFRNPYETLVAVMLSAQCTDKQVNKVTPALFERYPTVRDMAAASVEDVYPMVKSCGFKTKAANIVSACRLIMQNHGGEVPGTMEALTALPGVGRKTANIVMNECFDKVEGIAVDTHVFRIAHRLKFSNKKTPGEVEKDLLSLLPSELWKNVNSQWIRFGREYCIARKPRCDECPCVDLCPTRPGLK